MRAAAFLTLLLASAVSLAAHSQATLTVQADKPVHAVSPMLYGLMTEEINYSYDGGLYAEMVRNRTFGKGFNGLNHWYLDVAGDSHATIRFNDTDSPGDAIYGSLQMDVQAADATHAAALRNDGFWGMPLKSDTVYNGSLYARGDIGDLTVSLVGNNSGKTFASAAISGITGDWKQYTFSLRTGKVDSPTTNHLLIGANKAGTVMLSLVSLFPPTYNNRPNGNRADIMEMMAGMHPKFLRMPGGNYLEGDQIDERFDWKTTLGPLVERPTHRSPWNYQSTDGMGLLEFLQWTEDLKIEPVLAVFAGYALKGDYIHPGPALKPFVEDALDEIEFVTGDTSTRWGAVRAKLGHPAPFPLQYVEIGNEDNFDKSGSYDARYAQFHRAIKAKYPQLQVIATTPVKGTVPDVLDDHYYKRAEEFFTMATRYDNTPRNGPKIFVGEWATREGAPTTDWGAALGDAAWMTGMERNSDVIVMAAYAPLFVNVNPGGMQWESNLIGYDATRVYGSPSYYAQALFAQYLGTEVSQTLLTGGVNSRFFYSVTRAPARGELYLKLVNASTEPQVLDLKLEGAHISGDATLVTLHANNRAATNTIADPERIVPSTVKLRAAAQIHLTVPPLTVQVLSVPAK